MGQIHSVSKEFGQASLDLLKLGKIIDKDETPQGMLFRVISGIKNIEGDYFTNSNTSFIKLLEKYLFEKKIVPSTPILTNIGRYPERPLSACSFPPVNLSGDLNKIRIIINHYHKDGMGTSFCLDDIEEPIEMLLYLNQIAIEDLNRIDQNRPVGNMASLNISHTKIADFITSKKEKRDIKWAFNLSVNVDNLFMKNVINNNKYALGDGTMVCANDIFNLIVSSAYETGEPGIIFLDVLNKRNVLQNSINYSVVATCGEVGLGWGETCQFTSINIAEFENNGKINYDDLRNCVRCCIRFLDDCLEYSIVRYHYPETKKVMEFSRKVGLGICGFSQLLTKLNIHYASKESLELISNILSFINYWSKNASVELAEERGSFEGFYESKYILKDFYLTKKFGIYPTNLVSKDNWKNLDLKIKETGIRNSTTIILPPTGRSSIIYETSPQIEPLFTLLNSNKKINKYLIKYIKENYDDSRSIIQRVYTDILNNGSIQGCNYLNERIKKVFRIAIEIPYKEHLAIISYAQRFTDEAISKTINLPRDISKEEIREIFMFTYRLGLNGITIYRDSTIANQPVHFK